MRQRTTGLLATSLLASTLVVVTATSAQASCMLDERSMEDKIASADVLFVGTVNALAHGNTTAQIEVEEVWAGDGLDDLVTVVGGSGQDGMATSIDRSWEPNGRYLVFAYEDNGHLADNSCTPTQPWSEDLAAFRPADAEVRRSPTDPSTVDVNDAGSGEPGTSDTPDSFPIVPAIATVAVVGAAAGVWMSRRRTTV